MKTILRYILIHLVLFFGFSVSLSAQAGSVLTLDEGSFRLEQTNALGGVNIDPIGKDRSNRACFRLKLHLDRMTPEDIRQVEVKVLGGNVVLMKRTVASGGNGLILEMTARPDTRFYIKHSSLGESNTVTISPEADKVYLMDGWADQKLTVVVYCAKPGADVWLDGTYRGKIGPDNTLNIPDILAGAHSIKVQSGEDSSEQSIEVSPTKVSFNIELKSAAHLQQLVVFNVTPADALVELDGKMLVVNGGQAMELVKFGTYSYNVAAANYHSETGSVTVNDNRSKKIVTVNLKPASGWIEVVGASAEGAYVYVDNRMIGKAPIKSNMLSSGSHVVKIVKSLYKGYETTVNVTDGQVTRLDPALQADYSDVTLTVAGNAEIRVNGELKGRGHWRGRLGRGAYLVETRKGGHRPATTTITITEISSSQTFTLTPPEPVYGILYVKSDQNSAEVYLDGTHIGQTPLYLPETLIGSHTLKISKSGCTDWKGNVTVEEGQIAEVNAALQGSVPVTFTTTLSGAKLYLDGIFLGPANGTYDVAFGSHTAICRVPGKDYITMVINVNQNSENHIVHFTPSQNANIAEPKSNRNKDDEHSFGAARETITVNGVSFDMIMVEGGTFTMGATSEQGNDAYNSEKPAHKVTLSDYYIGETEVTQALWQAVMGNNPSSFKGSSNPVESVSWNDCQEFISKLNSLTGRTFRLPTDAEWEYAARGGIESKGYKYSGSNSIDNVAWYSSNSSTKTHAVKTKSPNELGIYDMSGNVLEWCQDWYGSYSSNAQTNPKGPSVGSDRVLRGGSWSNGAMYCRVSLRISESPDFRFFKYGLRLVLVP